jgi:hypothetical protein
MAHTVKITEVGNIDVIVKAGLQQGDPFIRFNFFVVNEDFNHIFLTGLSILS